MNMSHSSSEHLDVDARQELLSTMSSFSNQSPPFYHPQDPAYILTSRPPLDWQPTHPSSSQGQVSQGFTTQSPSPFGSAVLRTPFSENVFWPSTTTSNSTSTNSSNSNSNSNSQFANSYIPIHQQYPPSSSSIYQQTSAYGSIISLAATFPHNTSPPGIRNILAGHPHAQTVTPNILQASTPMPYPHLHSRPMAIPASQTAAHPYGPFSHHRAAQPSQSASSASSDMTTMMMLSATSSEDVAMGGLPLYDSELLLSSPSSATDDESLADSTDKLLARQLLRAPPASDPEAKDAFLLQAKRLGLSYREIKQRGNFREAESTLRGRYRTITKSKDERVRKPVWTKEDIALLRQAVEYYAEVHTRMRARRSVTSASENANSQPEIKVPWKKVSAFIAENGGSYRFGNATCKKKWFEIMGQQQQPQPQPMEARFL